MNTTSMEFVICQEEVSKGSAETVSTPGLVNALASTVGLGSTTVVKRAPSPLVMSEFMGISNTMSKGALQINPWNLGVSWTICFHKHI